MRIASPLNSNYFLPGAFWCCPHNTGRFTWENCGHEVILYNADKVNYTVQFARWVCDLLGEFCRFLIGPKKIFSNRAIYRTDWPNHFALLAERERTTTILNERGWEDGSYPCNYDECRFDAFCKSVLRNEAHNYRRGLKHQRDRLVSIGALSQADMDKLCTADCYPSNSFTFSSHGYDLHINNELVADAFASLSAQMQSILILRFVLDLGDVEIGSFVGMSWSTVQRHRKKTLDELRSKLTALMPKGGWARMMNPSYKGRALLPMPVIEAARAGEQV